MNDDNPPNSQLASSAANPSPVNPPANPPAPNAVISPIILAHPVIIDTDDIPKPATFLEIRDVSTSSREELKRQVERRKMTLTVPERNFLDHLVIHGNEIEVQLAYDKLGDDELFFEWQTPGQLKSKGPPKTPITYPDTNEEGGSDEDAKETPTSRPFLHRNLSLGSQRRLRKLEERKQETSALWRAHESGIAVTHAASKKSLLKRTSSFTSPPHIENSLSNLKPTNSLASLIGSGPKASEIFRRVDAKMVAASPLRKARFQRSKSMMATPPRVPDPIKVEYERRSSSASRKSVTFDPETPNRQPASSKHLRISISDSFASATLEADASSKLPSGRPPLAQRNESVSSISSIRSAHPVRSDSISSVPSIHHANAIRSESISSVPSIHQAHSIRSDSISSIPSIHHANIIRSDSISTFSSINSVQPIHNKASIFTERDRSNSTSSVPSIRSAHPIHQNPFSFEENSDTPKTLRNSMVDKTKEKELLAAYSATPDIASAWLHHQQDHFQTKAIDLETSTIASSESFPPAITIPSTVTERTETSTTDSSKPEADTSRESPLMINNKTVLVRRASQSLYEGEGMEVTETDCNKPFPTIRPSLGLFESMNISIYTCNSLDEDTMSYYSHRQNNYDEIFRDSVIRRTLSDEEVAAANFRDFFVGSNVNLLSREVSNMTLDNRGYGDDKDVDDVSWDLKADARNARFDSWNILKDEYVNGYGGGGTLDFRILGTCADDESASPHVLSPPLMESLSGFLPYSQSGENFFLRYSLVRDGASMLTFLKRARGVQYAILALETVDGEVFGCFTGQAWRKNWNYFGTGESFLWKMRRSRMEKTTSILEQAQLESEIDVYPFTRENKYIQLCTHDRIAVGGGTPKSEEKKINDPPIKTQEHEWGFGLAIQGDLLEGTSSPCVTFGSPSLSNVHSDGSLFEIVNLELWTFTPCATTEDAERLELGKLFLH